VRVIEKKEQSNSSASTSAPVQNANAQRAAQRNQVASELNANAQQTAQIIGTNNKRDKQQCQ
jgi:hypothetical protein